MRKMIYDVHGNVIMMWDKFGIIQNFLNNFLISVLYICHTRGLPGITYSLLLIFRCVFMSLTLDS